MVNFTAVRLLVVSLLAVWFQVAAATPTPVSRDLSGVTTNAERLRRGLPLIKPRNMKRASGTLTARTSRPSGGAPQKRCIKVVKKSGRNDWETVGYINDGLDGSGYFPISDRKRDCLEIYRPNHGNVGDIELAGAGSDKKYLGLAGDSRFAAAYLVRSNQTPAGSGPATVGNSASPALPKSETNIWTYNSGSERLSPLWKNELGAVVSPVRTYIRDSRNNRDRLFFAHKHDEFARAYDDEVEVYLELTDDD